MKKTISIIVITITSLLLVGCNIKKYKVVFDFDNGQENLVTKVRKNNTIDFPEEPKKEGFQFAHWTYNEEEFQPDTKVLEHLNLVASWGKVVTSADKIIYAYNNHLNSINFDVEGVGTADAGIVKQSILINKSRKDNNVSLYNASYGRFLIEINPYVEFKGNINEVTLEKGTTNRDLTKSKVLSTEKMAYEEVANLYGTSINDLNYIINEETIINVSEMKSNKYKILLDLVKSTPNYITNIHEMNPQPNLKDSIVFSKIELVITLDDQGYFQTISYNETYSLKVQVLGSYTNQTINSLITETYRYN